MPWQRQVVDVGLERDPDTGLYVYGTVIVTVQRQSGKTTLVLSVATHRCLTLSRARVWYTCQTGKDAGDWFRNEARPIFDDSLFRGRYKTRMSQGSEGMTWHHNASSFRVFPPLRDGLHGKQSDLVFSDEAWAHDEVKGDELKQAIRPTMATRPGAQKWPLSTMGDATSLYLDSYIELGLASVRADRREGVCFLDWGIPDDLDPTDVDRVADYHPAVGFTIPRQALWTAFDDLRDKPGEFARAYGNRKTRVGERVIPAAAWEACAVAAPAWQRPEPQQLALAFEVAVDGSDAAITAAWRYDPLGPVHVDVIDHRPGTSWLADRVVELRDTWRPRTIAHNAAGPAVDVADELRRRGVTLYPVATREYVAACVGFLRDVLTEGRLLHPGHPALDLAAESAGQRQLGEAWAWGPRASVGSISPLVGVTVARWAFDHGGGGPLFVSSRRRS